MSQRVHIQNAILDLVLGNTESGAQPVAKFVEVPYVEGRPQQIDYEAADTVVPASAHVNETGQSFQEDTDVKHKRVQKCVEWTFDLTLAWNVEVTLEFFLKAVTENVPLVAKDETEGWQQCRLYFGQPVRVSHGAQQQSPSGTNVTIAIKGKLGRV